MVTDPIADLLTRIRNGYMARKKTVSIPTSKFKEEIIKVLVKESYLASYKRADKEFEVALKYEGDKPSILGIKMVSKPGIRIYRGVKRIPRTLSSYGVTIVSTPQGVMTDRQAKKQNVGGEVICQIW